MNQLEKTVEVMTEAQRMNEEVHQLWTPREPTTEAEKIVAAIDTLNRSLDRRLDRVVDVFLLLSKAIECL